MHLAGQQGQYCDQWHPPASCCSASHSSPSAAVLALSCTSSAPAAAPRTLSKSEQRTDGMWPQRRVCALERKAANLCGFILAGLGFCKSSLGCFPVSGSGKKCNLCSSFAHRKHDAGQVGFEASFGYYIPELGLRSPLRCPASIILRRKELHCKPLYRRCMMSASVTLCASQTSVRTNYGSTDVVQTLLKTTLR